MKALGGSKLAGEVAVGGGRSWPVKYRREGGGAVDLASGAGGEAEAELERCG